MAVRRIKRTTTEYITRITGSDVFEIFDLLNDTEISQLKEAHWETDGDALLFINPGTVLEVGD